MGFNPLRLFIFAHNGLKPHCYKKWIATPLARNDKFKINNDGLKICNDNFNYAFSCASNFEIISQSDYGFCYKNYFFNLNQVFRNSYDFGESFGRSLNYDFGKNHFGNCNFGFDFGNEIYSIGNNLAGFLFNRKIQQKKIIFKEKKR